jgi:hypothetical protein
MEASRGSPPSGLGFVMRGVVVQGGASLVTGGSGEWVWYRGDRHPPR